MYPSLSEALGEEITPATSAERLWQIADRLADQAASAHRTGLDRDVAELDRLGEHRFGLRAGPVQLAQLDVRADPAQLQPCPLLPAPLGQHA